MQRHRLKTAVILATGGLTAAIVALAPVSGSLFDGDHADKLAHAAGFTLLTAGTLIVSGAPASRVAIGLIAFGVLIELLQILAPLHQFSLQDLAANAVGVGLALAVNGLWRRHRRTRTPRSETRPKTDGSAREITDNVP